MREHEREYPRDDAFEALLAQSVAELPPEEIVADVTPWRRAMDRILFGMALCAVTLNFWCLNYILPAIGTVLLLLGFRTLRRENRWLGGCFAVTVIRAACFFATLILNMHGDICLSVPARPVVVVTQISGPKKKERKNACSPSLFSCRGNGPSLYFTG